MKQWASLVQQISNEKMLTSFSNNFSNLGQQ